MNKLVFAMMQSLDGYVDGVGDALALPPPASPQLRARLLSAVGATTVPTFFIHAANDYSVAPGKALAAEMTRVGRANRLKIYPSFGTTASEGHNMVDLGVAVWEDDVFAFLTECLRR